jgi:type III secretory pathway component EscS
MTNQPSESDVHNAIYLGKILTTMANRVSTELVGVSSWLILGFSAILGLLLANLETVSKFLEPTTIGVVIKLFAVSVLLHVVLRYLAAIVIAGAALGKELESIPPGNIDVLLFTQRLEAATLWPSRYMVRWSNRKILEGDLAVGGRMSALLAQVLAWLALVQAVTAIAAVLVIANSLKG